MLDEHMFEDIHEIAENSAYLKAVEDKVVCLDMLKQLPPYSELKEIEEALRKEGKLSFPVIFGEATGFYMIKCFLIADYAVDKALFVKDVENYRKMRFETARQKIAKVLFDRFVSTEEHQYDKGSSVFEIVQRQQRDSREHSKSSHHKDNKDNKESKEPSKSSHIVKESISVVIEKTERSTTTDQASLLRIGQNNPIGVYGRAVERVRAAVSSGNAPSDCFDEVYREVMNDLKLDVFPRFKQSDFYKRYIQTKWIETAPVSVKDFATFRVLGRGGFGVVHACRKVNSGSIYAMKSMSKRLIKSKKALANVMDSGMFLP